MAVRSCGFTRHLGATAIPKPFAEDLAIADGVLKEYLR
jgi:hypothetical protein